MQAAMLRRQVVGAVLFSKIPSLIFLNGKVLKHPKTKQKTLPNRKRGDEKFWRKV